MSIKGFRERTPIISCTVDGVRETLYTCPNNCRARVQFIYLVNGDGAVAVTLEIYKAGVSTHYYILSSKNMALGDTFCPVERSYIVLEPGDKLEVTAVGTAPLVDAFCTVEEIFIPVG